MMDFLVFSYPRVRYMSLYLFYLSPYQISIYVNKAFLTPIFSLFPKKKHMSLDHNLP